jgi:purine/pyrimidine-nucleoside phosphorylase
MIEQEIIVDKFNNVTVVKKANIYFNGNVTSRTVLFDGGTRKTLGIILPGEYEFGTADRERMEILAGTLKALLPGSKEWKSFGPGQAFEIPANSKFKVAAAEIADYCCSYIKE